MFSQDAKDGFVYSGCRDIPVVIVPYWGGSVPSRARVFKVLSDQSRRSEACSVDLQDETLTLAEGPCLAKLDICDWYASVDLSKHSLSCKARTLLLHSMYRTPSILTPHHSLHVSSNPVQTTSCVPKPFDTSCTWHLQSASAPASPL